MGLVLRGARLIDGTGRDPVDRPVVTIEGDRIRSVSSDGPIAAGADVIDADGLVLLPGLIDAHSHLGLAVDLQSASVEGLTPLAELAARIFHNVELALDAGFTTVREVGGLDGGVARAVEIGLLRGPRILPAGPLLSQTGGHGDLRPTFCIPHPHDHGVVLNYPGLVQMSRVCDGADEVRLAARNAFKTGATHIKVCVSGGVVSFTDKLEDAQFSVAELRAAVEEAEARGTYVTAHAHGIDGMLNGLEAGVKCFEHGTFLDEATAAKLAAAGAALVPTLAVARLMRTEIAEAMNFSQEIIDRAGGIEEGMSNAMKLARDAGVLVGSGSDLIGPGQNRRGLEIALHAGVLDAMQAIVQTTLNNAKIIGRDADLGTVEQGKIADLVAIDGDPLTDPDVFDDPSRIVLVIKGGAICKDTRV